MKHFKIAAVLYVVSIIFAHIETWYFLRRDGYHYYAETTEEKICDNIALLIFGLGVAFFIEGIFRASQRKET